MTSVCVSQALSEDVRNTKRDSKEDKAAQQEGQGGACGDTELDEKESHCYMHTHPCLSLKTGFTALCVLNPKLSKMYRQISKKVSHLNLKVPPLPSF